MPRNTRIAVFKGLLTGLFALCASGCFQTFNLPLVSNLGPPKEYKTFDVERVRLCNDYLENQQYTEALAVIRQEVDDPVITNEEQLAFIRINAIHALAEYVRFHPASVHLDAEALRYYREGIQYARTDEASQVTLHHMMALYYSFSDRNGAMLAYLQKERDYYRRTNNTYQLIICYDGLADGYYDAGQRVLADYYRQRTLALAREYFVLGRRPDENEKGYQWVNYVKILRDAMDHYAEPGNTDQILALWKIQEPVIKAHITPEYIGYLDTAEFLALTGAIGPAKQLFQQAQRIGEEEFALNENALYAPMDIICSECQVRLQAAEYRQAAAAAGQCLAMRASNDIESAPRDLGIFGLAHEAAGNPRQAITCFKNSIAKYETMRASYSVTERAAFFRSIQRQSYWGLMRCLAREAIDQNSEPDFFEALRISELIRARQFGELLDKGPAVELTPASLIRLARQLPRDTVVLDYVFTDSHILLFAIARSGQTAELIPYDRRGFRRQVRILVNELATPDSHPTDIERYLLQVSQTLLASVRGLIKNKKQIVVLPDDALNALPFDLLSLHGGHYQPLLNKYIVRVAPSLRYLMRPHGMKRRKAKAGLFGLADPLYAVRPAPISEIPTTDLRAIARGEEYLAYFKALPETRTEVEKIAAMFVGEPVKIMLGSGATESALKTADLRPYAYIHLATHGILGDDVPGIPEPALVLARESGNNGFLTAGEASLLSLNAELTVLSACNTGTGEYFTGEGVMGMSRAFLLAGSTNVLVSLWSIPSRETVPLMQGFYAYLKSGVPPAAALRAAKLDFIAGRPVTGRQPSGQRGVRVGPQAQATRVHRHPFYWAAFFMIGA